jgi:hypothetical protein
MDGANPWGAAEPSPLDAERERLRKAGYSETEISQILIAKETGAAQAAAPAGHAPLSGVASNLAAGATYARNFIPGMFANLATIRDPAATAEARGQATAALVVKAVAILVIAYVVLQEFSQLQSMTSRSSAEACAARQKVIVDTMPFNDTHSPYYKAWAQREAEFKHDCVGF